MSNNDKTSNPMTTEDASRIQAAEVRISNTNTPSNPNPNVSLPPYPRLLYRPLHPTPGPVSPTPLSFLAQDHSDHDPGSTRPITRYITPCIESSEQQQCTTDKKSSSVQAKSSGDGQTQAGGFAARAQAAGAKNDNNDSATKENEQSKGTDAPK